MAHRAYLQLAQRLAAAGFHVVRFDYYGCGDSAGSCEDGTPERWLKDICTAVGQVRLRSGRSELCVVGSRLGATLALIAAAERGDIHRMVLWDPIACGRVFLGELAQRHQQMLKQAHVRADATGQSDGDTEYLGFSIPEPMAAGIAQLRPLATEAAPAAELLLVDTAEATVPSPLRKHLQALGSNVEHQWVPVPRAWSWIEDPGTVLVPTQVLNVIVGWITRANQ